MKVIVAGGGRYVPTDADWRRLDDLYAVIDEVVSSGSGLLLMPDGTHARPDEIGTETLINGVWVTLTEEMWALLLTFARSGSVEVQGAAVFGEAWAIASGLPYRRFLPDRKRLGNRAEQLRDREMVEYADAAVMFPGEDVEGLRVEAKAAGLTIYDGKATARDSA